ncbi:MAG: hypothetical protein N2517_07275 [Ignavibacteria bacterium]|nr:hypothetical protein [Ignavibacteria bacterium]
MDESKAINPEIKGLFETVKRQALEYSKAFEFFEEEKKIISQKLEELENFSQHILEEIENKIKLLENTINDFISDFQQKSASFEVAYKELDRIELLKQELNNQNSELKVQMIKFDSLLKTFENKVELEFESLSRKVLNMIENEISSSLKKFEVKYALKIKSLEEKVVNFEQKLLALTLSQSRFTKTFYEETDTMQQGLQQIKQALYDERQKIEARFSEFSEELNKKLIRFDQLLNQIEQQTETTIQNKEESSNKIRDEVRQAFQYLNEFRIQQSKIENTIRRILIFGTLFILIFVVLLFAI